MGLNCGVTEQEPLIPKVPMQVSAGMVNWPAWDPVKDTALTVILAVPVLVKVTDGHNC